LTKREKKSGYARSQEGNWQSPSEQSAQFSLMEKEKADENKEERHLIG
jgi:hypothetical protein